MFSWFREKKAAKADEIADLSDWGKECSDCGVRDGQLHDLFCTKELCPFCRGQLATCDCLCAVLNLGERERQILEEYIDDSVEPLLSIMNRWKEVLNDKGRVPFQAMKLSAVPEDFILVAARGELPFVRRMLADGLPVDVANKVGYTPLMAAAHNYRLETVKLLLDAGADVFRLNVRGETPLHCAVAMRSLDSNAARLNQAECVRLLLEKGAEINLADQSGGTALMSAACFGCTLSVKVLLNAGADSTLRDHKGRSAEDLARERGWEDVVHLLTS